MSPLSLIPEQKEFQIKSKTGELISPTSGDVHPPSGIITKASTTPRKPVSLLIHLNKQRSLFRSSEKKQFFSYFKSKTMHRDGVGIAWPSFYTLNTCLFI